MQVILHGDKKKKKLIDYVMVNRKKLNSGRQASYVSIYNQHGGTLHL